MSVKRTSSGDAKLLKLGPLPRAQTIRLTITMPKSLGDALAVYAEEFSRLHGHAESAELIPHMLEAFLRSDRAFMRRHAKSLRSSRRIAPLPMEAVRSPADEKSASS